MPSYLITGASRGLGYEFLRQFSADPSSIVIGLVRDKETADKKVATELKRDNVHLFQADLSDYESIKRAVQSASEVTGGSLDYIIANGAYTSDASNWASVEKLAEDPKQLETELLISFTTNVIGHIHLFNFALPLVLKGNIKKVITISSGMADDDLTRSLDIDTALPYSVSKAAMNTAVAKFSAQYRKSGILFLSISPGAVDTSDVALGTSDLSQTLGSESSDLSKAKGAIAIKFQQYAPHWKGPISPEESVKAVMAIVDKASVEAGDGGSFISHTGTKSWL